MKNISEYERFFAFGCSFTDYRWPTWADIIGNQIDLYYNFGGAAHSNSLIARSVIRANLLHNFTENDLIIIQWTDILRDEYYTNGIFRGTGNILHNTIFDTEIELENMAAAYYQRDYEYISMINENLILKNLEFNFISMSRFLSAESSLPFDVNQISPYRKFQSVPNFLEECFQGDWNNSNSVQIYDGKETIVDRHPDCVEHLDFVVKIWPSLIDKMLALDYINQYQGILSKGLDITRQGHIHDKTKRMN